MDLYHEALEDHRKNLDESAVEKLNRVLADSPGFEDAYEALAVILYNLKKYDDAIAVIKKWIVLNPNSIMSHTNLSRCYVAKGMILEAEHEQGEARRLTWKADLKAKKMEMPKVNYEDQIARFKKVIEYDPQDVLGYFSLGNAYLESGKKREAVDTFEKAVQVDPKHTSSYLGLGMALESLGDFEKAKRIYLQGIKVAEVQGDMMPQKKMESRLKAI
ncbi:MAG: tetratricopeptide repeat protein [Candidatus Omnitrophica bacterium]|nr:tetratricopeptide repeat protein [Candidatus Omnitrophota bacterium]